MPSLAEMLMGYLPSGASPVFGTTTPQEQAFAPPTGLDQAVGGAINSMATLPQRAIQNSQFALNTGVYDPAVPLEAAMTTMGATPFGSGMAGTSPVFGAGPIKAYHGSPYDFEKFDLSKIGTGEGAQAYGHGLYFAENPAVSESYKAAGQPSYLGADRIKAAQDLLAEAGGDRQAAIALADTRMRGTTKYSEGKLWTDVVNNFDDLVGKSPGKMYEVNINADPAHFLDWDKPLSEQHPKVQEAATAAVNAVVPDWQRQFVTTGGELMRKGGHQQAAEALRDAGIPGIKYLDQGSRLPDPSIQHYLDKAKSGLAGAEMHGDPEWIAKSQAEVTKWEDMLKAQRTSNYVVFNDKLIDILRKYGLAGAAATGAMSPAYGPPQPNMTAQALMEGS